MHLRQSQSNVKSKMWQQKWPRSVLGLYVYQIGWAWGQCYDFGNIFLLKKLAKKIGDYDSKCSYLSPKPKNRYQENLIVSPYIGHDRRK
jgi:hypothetical protein